MEISSLRNKYFTRDVSTRNLQKEKINAVLLLAERLEKEAMLYRRGIYGNNIKKCLSRLQDIIWSFE